MYDPKLKVEALYWPFWKLMDNVTLTKKKLRDQNDYFAKKNSDAAWHMSPITYSETLHWLNTETHSTSPLQSISLFGSSGTQWWWIARLDIQLYIAALR